MTVVAETDRLAFDRFLANASIDEALDFTSRLVEGGLSVSQLITDLLAPAQEEVGFRWQRGEWSTAQEAAATSVVDAVLSSLQEYAPVAPTRGRVAVTTVEGDWHAVGARMVAEVLRDEGFAVSFLGPSVPALRLPKLLTVDTDAVVLSCSMACHLPSARRCIEVLLDARYPVLIGGRAVTSEARAVALGASAWAPNASGVGDAVMRALEARAHPVRATVEEAALEASRSELVERLVDGLMLEWPDLARLDAVALNRVRIGADRLVTTVQAAVMLHDDEVLTEYMHWLRALDGSGQGDAPSGVLLLAAERAFAGHPAAVAAVHRACEAATPARSSVAAPSTTPAIEHPVEKVTSAEEMLRTRARASADRLSNGVRTASDDPSAVRSRAASLLQEVDRLRTRQETPAGRSYGVGRGEETLDAARAQAARLLTDAELDAERIRRDARVDAEATAAAAAASATALIEQAEEEGLEMLAEAASEVVQRLDEASVEAQRIIAEANSLAEEMTNDTRRQEAEFSEALARQARTASEEAQLQVARATAMANEIVAKARAESAEVLAQAQRERSEVAQEVALLIAEAVAQLDRARAEAGELRAETGRRRGDLEGDIEQDVRRVMQEAQADASRILEIAHAEAARIVADAAARAETQTLDLRDPAAEQVVRPEPKRRRRRIS